MVSGFDAGPVYLKEDLSPDGLGEEIYIRASNLAAEMIRTIIAGSSVPFPQTGQPVVFERRQAAQSDIPTCATLAVD